MTDPVPGGATAARPTTLNPLARGTLGRQLVTRVVALIAVLAVALSLVSLVVAGLTMVRSLDREVSDGADRDFSANRTAQTTGRTPATQHIGRPSGSVTVTVDVHGVMSGLYLDAAGTESLETEDLNALLAVPRDNQIHTVHLPHLGAYRVYAGTKAPPGADVPPAEPGRRPATGTNPSVGPAAYIISGQPLRNVESQLGSMAAAELLLTLLAVTLAMLVMRHVVRRSLRPLNELADTAYAVSQLELDKGQVALEQRARVDAAQPNNEVTRVGAAFNLMLDHVGEALNAREQSESRVRKFVADASHELRNPLAAIRGYAEITRRQRDALPPDAAFAMGRIEAESERMSSLVEDMLLLARLDNNRGLELSDVDLTEQLIHAVSDARVAGPDHTWALELPDEPVVVRGDAHRLYQVVVNLLTNARVHTPPGCRIVTALDLVGPNAVIRVADNGPGIPAAIQDRLFDRFVRADASRVRQSSSSTGLGLAIVRSVVEAHGGTVAVDSAPGHTTFQISLPLQGPAPGEPAYRGA